MIGAGYGKRRAATGSSALLTVGVIAVIAVVAVGAVVLRTAPDSLDLRAADTVLWTVCGAFALVAGFVSCMRGRMVGDASARRVGAALLASAVLVATTDVLTFADRGVDLEAALLRFDAATCVVFVALLTVACGLLYIVKAVAQELTRAFVDQREQLFDHEVEAEVAEARRRAEQHERAERAHEVRSAVLAIQSAVGALARTYDDGGSRDRPSLPDAILAEIELLRQLVSDEPARPSFPFEVADSLLPVVVCHRACGLEVDVHLARGLWAVGNPAELGEVVQGLLDNARVHAPASPVTVRASQHGDSILVRVSDHGPGIPERQRERVFARGVSTRAVDGGLGLYVARRLLATRGGDLAVEPVAGGGAAFVVRLPAASRAAVRSAGEEPRHDVDDVTRTIDPDTLQLVARDQ
jgi:signal transduction histidine kinase